MDIRKEFLDELKKTSPVNSDIADVYRHIFSCMEHEALTYHLEFLKEEVKKEWWFVDFHKSMRQTDFFPDVFVHYDVNEQTYEDIEEIERLNKILPHHTEQGMTGIVNSQESKELGLEKEYSRYLTLKRKKSVDKKRLIGGHLDMILWNMIHLDKENFLKRFIENFYKQILIEKL